MPNLYIIAGCNGAGKTTASFTVLPEMLDCKEFVNADEIARGLSPFQPETVSFQAGRLMLHRIKSLLPTRVDFAFETTLSTRYYAKLILEARVLGYNVTLLYFWLNDPQLAIDRVAERVKRGGHHIDSSVIIRRYSAGLKLLSNVFINLVDGWVLIDNSKSHSLLIAERDSNKAPVIFDPATYNQIIKPNEASNN